MKGGVAALALVSGAAANTYTIAEAGEHIVAQKTFYGGSYNLLAHTLPRYGITTTFVDAHDLAEVEGAIQENTKAIYLKTLGNPNSDIPDIDAFAESITYARTILLRDTGAAISPFNAFLLLQGVETLSLRLDRHAENTKKVVAFLANHLQVEHVNHPSLPEHPTMRCMKNTSPMAAQVSLRLKLRVVRKKPISLSTICSCFLC